MPMPWQRYSTAPTGTPAPTAPPTSPSPSPAVDPTQLDPRVTQEMRRRMLDPYAAERMHEGFAQQMFGVPFASLTSTEKASVAQQTQQMQQQAANLPDDAFLRLYVSNPNVTAGLQGNDDGYLQAVTQYVRANPTQPLPTVEQQRLNLDQWQDQQQNGLTQGNMSGYYNGAPTLARENQEFNQNNTLAQLAANPRNIAQWLGMMGMDPQQVLGATPAVQNALSRSGMQQNGAQATMGGNPMMQGTPDFFNNGYLKGKLPPGGGPNPTDDNVMYTGGSKDFDESTGLYRSTGTQYPPGNDEWHVDQTQQQPYGNPPSMYASDQQTTTGLPPQPPDPSGNQSNFNFINGRQAGFMSNNGIRGMMNDFKNGTSNAQLTTGLASFSGQDPNDFWSDFQNSLPKGQATGGTRFGGGGW